MGCSKKQYVLFGLLMAVFLYSAEITVVGTAGPTILKELGGIDYYSWLFTSYLFSSTLSMPFWGRYADHLGRKKLYILSLTIFLIGSILCGLSQSMLQLVIARSIKGFGGGGLLPIAFTIIADIYSLKERGRVQGIVSATWGVSTVIGPFIGGSLTEFLGWRSIFFVNLLPGLTSFYLITKYFYEKHQLKTGKVLSFKSLFSAAGLMTTLLLGLRYLQIHKNLQAAALIFTAVFMFVLFIYYEKTTAFPLIPHSLRTHRVFVVSCASGFFFGAFLIGHASFAHLLFQDYYLFSPTVSGLTFAPLTLGWFLGTLISTKLMLRYSYKILVLIGASTTLIAFLFFVYLFLNLTLVKIIALMFVMGLGMSFNYPIVLITTQHSVPKDQIGFSTSGLAWIRNIGSTIGTTFMGLILSLLFHEKLLDLSTESLKSKITSFVTNKNNSILDFKALQKIIPQDIYKTSLSYALENIYFIMGVCILFGLFALFFYPNEYKIEE